MRSILKVFLKGGTWKFTWNGLQIPCIGIYSGLIGKTLVLGSWMHEKYSLSVQNEG
jgi:hypothetical protein